MVEIRFIPFLPAFHCAAPTVWNSLATDITNSCSLTVFKSKLKTYIFCQTFTRSN